MNKPQDYRKKLCKEHRMAIFLTIRMNTPQLLEPLCLGMPCVKLKVRKIHQKRFKKR